MKYKVVRFTSYSTYDVDEGAILIKEKYGLPHTLQEVEGIWLQYSESMAAGWLIDSQEAVEEAFNVKLEEVSDEE